MEYKLKELLDKLTALTESHIVKAVRDYQNLDAEELLLPPATGGWSIAQCLDHLNGYGSYYLPLMRAALDKAGETKGIHRSTWLGDYFTRALDPDTGKKKLKAFKKHIPSAELDARAVVGEFIRQQEQLLQLLREARNRDLIKPRIPISLTRLITMNLGDTFRFLIAHNERHIRQADHVFKGLGLRV